MTTIECLFFEMTILNYKVLDMENLDKKENIADNEFGIEKIYNDKPVPKHIHFIWVGGEMPSEYLLNISIINRISSENGFTVNLWVDNLKHYKKSVDKVVGYNIGDMFSKKHKLNKIKIRAIDELITLAKQHDFFKNNLDKKLLRDFVSFSNREGVGLYNQAARADMYRALALYLFGGYYLDIDNGVNFRALNRTLKINTNEINDYDFFSKLKLLRKLSKAFVFNNTFIKNKEKNEARYIELKKKIISLGVKLCADLDLFIKNKTKSNINLTEELDFIKKIKAYFKNFSKADNMINFSCSSIHHFYMYSENISKHFRNKVEGYDDKISKYALELNKIKESYDSFEHNKDMIQKLYDSKNKKLRVKLIPISKPINMQPDLPKFSVLFNVGFDLKINKKGILSLGRKLNNDKIACQKNSIILEKIIEQIVNNYRFIDDFNKNRKKSIKHDESITCSFSQKREPVGDREFKCTPRYETVKVSGPGVWLKAFNSILNSLCMKKYGVEFSNLYLKLKKKYPLKSQKDIKKIISKMVSKLCIKDVYGNFIENGVVAGLPLKHSYDKTWAKINSLDNKTKIKNKKATKIKGFTI